jgi:hypothetical protein
VILNQADIRARRIEGSILSKAAGKSKRLRHILIAEDSWPYILSLLMSYLTSLDQNTLIQKLGEETKLVLMRWS